MTKTEALKALQEGKKITHKYFGPGEWIVLIDNYYEFEDGCQCPPDEFWSFREESQWLNNWKLYPQE